jgi:hypothetical protein
MLLLSLVRVIYYSVDLNVTDQYTDPACQCQDGWLSPRLKFVLSGGCITLIYRIY